jgi:hypothetical protein
MKQNKIEKSLYQALDSVPTIPFEELAELPYVRMSEHDYITRQGTKRNTISIRRLAFAAVMCIILLIPATGWFYLNKVPDSIIMLDVNPSLKIITNHKGEVLSVDALNGDAKSLLQGNNYKDRKLVETVAAIMSSMVDQSYLSLEKNTILLTVTNRSKQKADELRVQIITTILEDLKTRNITPVILSQTISREAKRSELAKQYQISEGKMILIEEILSVDNSYSMEALAGLSMEQLLQIAKKISLDLGSYNMTGNKEDITGEYEGNQTEDPGANDQKDSQEDSQEGSKDVSQDGDSNEDRDIGQQEDGDAGDEDSRESDDVNQSGEDREDQGNIDEDQQGDSDRDEDSSDNSGNDEKDITDNGNMDEDGDIGEGDQGDSQEIREEDDTSLNEGTKDDVSKEENQSGDGEEEASGVENNTEDTQGSSLEQGQGSVSDDEQDNRTDSGQNDESEDSNNSDED